MSRNSQYDTTQKLKAVRYAKTMTFKVTINIILQTCRTVHKKAAG